MAAPGEPVNPVNIPYAMQRILLRSGLNDAWDALDHILGDESLVSRIDMMVGERHEAGYQQYGSEMYQWPPAKRIENVLEELADAITYLTSGDIE